MIRILVLGSTGMLGSMVLKVLSQGKGFEVVGTQSHDLHTPFYFDALDSVEKLESIILSLRATIAEAASDSVAGSNLTKPLYFINCIGVLSPVKDAALAQAINARFPHALVDYAKTIGARVIHMSTNGVFAPRATPYKESEQKTATDIYGKSKSEGEVNVKNVLNIRTSIIGPSSIKKMGLFEWFRAQPDGATIQGYTNHRWNGVTTLQFAELCRRIIIGGHFQALRQEGSVVHFVPNQTVTKYELLVLFKKLLQKRITIQPTEDPRGAQAQLLACTSAILLSLFPLDVSMERAVNDLAPYAGAGY